MPKKIREQHIPIKPHYRAWQPLPKKLRFDTWSELPHIEWKDNLFTPQRSESQPKIAVTIEIINQTHKHFCKWIWLPFQSATTDAIRLWLLNLHLRSSTPWDVRKSILWHRNTKLLAYIQNLLRVLDRCEDPCYCRVEFPNINASSHETEFLPDEIYKNDKTKQATTPTPTNIPYF